ncbi:MAG: galactokinase [Spirosomataceae bacterium]
MTSDQVSSRFIEHFQHPAQLLVRSPGRINLIGEHTDYNGGFVLPASIDKEIYFAISPRTDGLCRVEAANLSAVGEFSVHELTHTSQGWLNYLIGSTKQVVDAGKSIGGFDLVFGGNIPTGAGLSSSAAVECGLIFCLNKLFSLGFSTVEMVKMAQKAENTFVGVNCGIMDQFASMFGQDNHVIRLDCRSLEYQYAPFMASDYSLILCDTGVKHSLGDSEYNTRRQECEIGIALLRQYYPAVQLLRDVTSSMLEEHRAELSPIVYQRCRYVIDEIERVPAACEDLQRNDLVAFGQKMYATHEGLQHLYEVSCPELDYLVAQARLNDAVLGARMMGGGFGGCTINLVRTDAAEAFVETMAAAYQAQFGIPLVTHLVRITQGTSVLTN